MNVSFNVKSINCGDENPLQRILYQSILLVYMRRESTKKVTRRGVRALRVVTHGVKLTHFSTSSESSSIRRSRKRLIVLHSGSLSLGSGKHLHRFRSARARLKDGGIPSSGRLSIYRCGIRHYVLRRRLVGELNASNVLETLNKLATALTLAKFLVSFDSFVNDV